MSKKVFIITRGDYSDYQICAVYSTKEKAEEARPVYGQDAEVNEWDLDATSFPKGRVLFYIMMERNGDVRHAQQRDPEDEGETEIYLDVLHTCMWAKDEKHAVKIANERRTQMIANGEWPEPEEMTLLARPTGRGKVPPPEKSQAEVVKELVKGGAIREHKNSNCDGEPEPKGGQHAVDCPPQDWRSGGSTM